MARLWIVTLLLLVLNVLVMVWPARTPQLVVQVSSPLRVGLVFDVGGRGDKSFNDGAYAGLQRAVGTLSEGRPIITELIEPGDGADREAGIRLLAANGFDLIIGVGFIFSDDLYAIAEEYPRVKFVAIDYAKYDANGLVMPPPNLAGVKFREEEGAFLVGAIAGLVSKSGRLGFVGGMDIPLIRKFEAGYRAGIAEVCKTCQVLAGYAGVTGEAFKNPGKGKELATAQYNAGADIVFHASGSTGLGVFAAARQLSHYAIGVDTNQWAEAPGRVLTSMIKRVDVAVFDMISDLVENRFVGGLRFFGLRERGVDYVYDDANRALIGHDHHLQIEALRHRITAGEIKIPTVIQ